MIVFYKNKKSHSSKELIFKFMRISFTKTLRIELLDQIEDEEGDPNMKIDEEFYYGDTDISTSKCEDSREGLKFCNSKLEEVRLIDNFLVVIKKFEVRLFLSEVDKHYRWNFKVYRVELSRSNQSKFF